MTGVDPNGFMNEMYPTMKKRKETLKDTIIEVDTTPEADDRTIRDAICVSYVKDFLQRYKQKLKEKSEWDTYDVLMLLNEESGFTEEKNE